MRRQVIVDTGPLVALINRRDRYHQWAKDRFDEIKVPLFTCEPVLTEACHLLRNSHDGSDLLLEFVHRNVVQVAFVLEREAEAILKMRQRYRNIPMSLADACLLRMAEQITGSMVLTLDSDFKIYRIHDRRLVPVIMPADRR